MFEPHDHLAIPTTHERPPAARPRGAQLPGRQRPARRPAGCLQTGGASSWVRLLCGFFVLGGFGRCFGTSWGWCFGGCGIIFCFCGRWCVVGEAFLGVCGCSFTHNEKRSLAGGFRAAQSSYMLRRILAGLMVFFPGPARCTRTKPCLPQGFSKDRPSCN